MIVPCRERVACPNLSLLGCSPASRLQLLDLCDKALYLTHKPGAIATGHMAENQPLSFHPEEKLITEPRLQTPPPEWQEPDIYDYGAERVLIVEHDLMVDLLVLNGFHAQEKALVLSKNGYPEYLVPRIQEALRASPDLPVFYLHDAAPFEASPVESLTRSLPWLEGRQVIDLGLTMDDAKSLPALKALPAGEWQGVIPAAAVLFVVLSPLLTSALEGNMSLAHVLADVQDSGGGFFGGDFG